jgi:hypothetical protein
MLLAGAVPNVFLNLLNERKTSNDTDERSQPAG